MFLFLSYFLLPSQIVPFSEENQKAKLQLCSKFLETFTEIKERGKNFADLSIDLLIGMREMLRTDPGVYHPAATIFLLLIKQYFNMYLCAGVYES